MKHRGFSRVELLVAIVVIILAGALVLPKLLHQNDRNLAVPSGALAAADPDPTGELEFDRSPDSSSYNSSVVRQSARWRRQHPAEATAEDERQFEAQKARMMRTR